ncbi:MAG: transposase [Bacteroidales bacterium]|nr:transposase [Bacteroidales bacterium]
MQTCFDCGHKKEKDKDQKVREWTCPVYGTHHERDFSAESIKKWRRVQLKYLSSDRFEGK